MRIKEEREESDSFLFSSYLSVPVSCGQTVCMNRRTRILFCIQTLLSAALNTIGMGFFLSVRTEAWGFHPVLGGFVETIEAHAVNPIFTDGASPC